MTRENAKPKDLMGAQTTTQVNQYIDSFPEPICQRLRLIRELIQRVAPDAEEGFSYGMPAYKTYGKPLVYFAAFPKHIGLYATPSGHEAFAKELSGYKQGKGSVQLPNDQPFPIQLIERIVIFRVAENKNKYGK